MQPQARLHEQRRTSRRTVADALDVVRQRLGVDEIARAEIQIGPLQLPSGKLTALVDVVFPDLRLPRLLTHLCQLQGPHPHEFAAPSI